MDTTQQQTRWFDLLALVQLCPGQVPADSEGSRVAITGNTRLLLFAFAQHANGATDETWVSRRTLRHETQMSINTLDTAISNLKRAGLLRIRKKFNDDSRLTVQHIWIIQRDRLKALVGDEISEELIAKVVKAAINDGSSLLTCSRARVEQVRSAIFGAAGSVFLDISEEALGEEKVLLSISVATKNKAETADEDAELPPEPMKAVLSLPDYERKYALSYIDELRDPKSLHYNTGEVSVDVYRVTRFSRESFYRKGTSRSRR